MTSFVTNKNDKFSDYIKYDKRKEKLFKDYQPGYIAQIEDSLNATDAQYNYTKITGKPETIEEYYANNRYLGNKANVIKDIKNNLQDKDRILRREENKNQSKSGKMYETSEEKLQAFPHGIKKRFFDWTTTEANRIYKELISNNYLSDWEIAVKEGEKIARDTEERARQREEEEEYELPSHNSNGNTIHYNSNGNPVASWEEEMAHWNSVAEEKERNQTQEANWDSQYLRDEEKRQKEAEKKAEQEAMKNSVIKNRRDVSRQRLIERTKRKRAQEEAAKAASMEKSGSSVAAPSTMPPPPPQQIEPEELKCGWLKIHHETKNKHYYYNPRTNKSIWTNPETNPKVAWEKCHSKSKNKDYWYNPVLKKSVWEDPTKPNTTSKGGKKTRKVKGKTMKKNIKVKKSMKKSMKSKK